ncbi:pyridoxal phosphate-dependent transferase [Lactarius akahatsu]|uniref:Pyridoxal phosphate-dependent transferase n=1 Tax=Lactarius akahatsu TaxID=416441 RepID=A0AAD4LS23_9AGAM|nr:pyridoxal phosphate-dependent transferase [Lactarius akahatsu]
MGDKVEEVTGDEVKPFIFAEKHARSLSKAAGRPKSPIARSHSSSPTRPYSPVPGYANGQSSGHPNGFAIHPSCFAYFPTACSFEGILEDLLSSSTSNPGFNQWFASPACTELEVVVMGWAAKLFGLHDIFWNVNEVGGGVIQTTASDSALTVVAARTRYVNEHPGITLESLIIYVTTQTHSFGRKAAMILGLRVRALDVDETVTTDNTGLTGDGLIAAVKEDHARGLHPFVLIATVGTTSSGAIDQVADLGAAIKKNYPSVWLHVDAAWAGVTLACPEYREIAQLPGINESADSLCINFHKRGLTNFDTSALWVRERKQLIDALDITPEFLRTKEGDTGTVIDYRNWHLSLGRRFRSLKLWFVLRSFGVESFQANIRKCIALNNSFTEHIRASPIFELVTPPSFALTVFRLLPRSSTAAGELDSVNALNREFYSGLQTRSSLVLTQTLIGEVFCIRFAVGPSRTEQSDIEDAWGVIKETEESTFRNMGYGH